MAPLRSDVRESLARLDPRELCNEAKVEKCRATRDLRSCGRVVQHVLVSCGHACLCTECSQRCDVCPICKSPIPRKAATTRLRLYDQLLEAELLPRTADDDNKDRDGEQWTVDVRRLHSFFDVALENNLASLVCHYVLDVCLDESAVSSDAVVAMLLDGAVVKEWCKKTYVTLSRSLGEFYNASSKQICSRAEFLDQSCMKLEGVAHVLEALEAPIIGSNSESLYEVQQLLERVRRSIQHLEVMSWCTRHRFLESVPARFPSAVQWKTAHKERKAAAQERSWPDYVASTGQLGPKPQASLFIEDAISNLGLGREDEEEGARDTMEMSWLRTPGRPLSPSLRQRWDGPGSQSSGLVYPPESIRTAIDLLFLDGSSEMLLAKRAIFLYYLFDRHWTLPDTSWRSIIDDYVGTFSIPRHFVLESLVFFLLDDNSEQAVEEACELLKEIAGPTIHPKIARLLLERRRPEAALMVLRCTGNDRHTGGRMHGQLEQSTVVPLTEAVTILRVFLENGLVTEGFLFQRAHWKRLRANESGSGTAKQHDSNSGTGDRKWSLEMDVLVGEMCWLSIQKGGLDRMLELPWQAEEEKVVRKCLLERATQDPSSPAGNLLAIFYIQRCRFVEAYWIHKRLSALEQQFLSSSIDSDKISHVQSASQKRELLTEKSIQVLPAVQRQRLLSGQIPDPLAVSTTESEPSVSCQDIDIAGVPPASAANVHTASGSVSLLGGPSPLFKNRSNLGFKFSGDATPPPTSAGHGWPSILHVQSPLFGNLTPQPPLTNGPISKKNGKATVGDGSSPVLGRRLRYEPNWDSTIGIYS